MGTNYYLHFKGEKIHIGKSSGGWCFALHVYPEHGIRDLDDWVQAFKYGTIFNEYDDPISVDGMMWTITDRKWHSEDFTDDFLEANQAERGPNGLLRSQIGRGCIGHGSGTWDLIVGEFS
jgi:hypothetical protein